MAYCVPVECDLLRLDLPILHIYLVSTQNHRDIVADSTEAKGRQSAWKLSQASRFATDEHSNAGSSKLAFLEKSASLAKLAQHFQVPAAMNKNVEWKS